MAPELSVVVASRGRPAALGLCLAALAQSDHAAMEVVVVACPAGAAALRAAGWEGRVKLEPFDVPNLAAARNRGLRLAAGEVVAFIDDDAVCEPTWAGRLGAAFADARVGAATGFTRGPDGIGLQWTAACVDATGRDVPLAVDPDSPSLHAGTASRAVKTPGTNCAFRRAALAGAGGFDPAFRFYLEDADLDLRLAAAGWLTAVVPRAEVQHGFLASAIRCADRVPRDLHEIGASAAVFLRRHAPGGDPGPRLAELRAAERRRLIAHMLAGRIEPGAVGRILATLEAGIAAGAARPLPPLFPLPPPAAPFLPFRPLGPAPGRVIAARPGGRAAAEAAAAAARAAGAVVTLLAFGPGWRQHRMRFRADGIWEQTGGLLGRSDRAARPLAPWDPAGRRDARQAAETARIARVRPVGAAGAAPWRP